MSTCSLDVKMTDNEKQVRQGETLDLLPVSTNIWETFPFNSRWSSPYILQSITRA